MAAPLLAPYSSLFDLSNRLILVTGGYGHLGRAIVSGLLSHGATVVVLGRNKSQFKETFAALLATAPVHFQLCDVSSTPSVREALATCRQQYGLPQVLINNAVYSEGQQPDALTDEQFARGLDGSTGSVYRCLREVLPYLRENGGGKIINVASMYGMVAPDFAAYDQHPQFLNPPHYGAAKAAVIQLTKYFASYLGPENIQVNCVSPGAFPSERVQKEGGFVAELERRSPLGRIGRPEDLAGAFVYLSAAASDFVTGHNLVVDGGWTIR
ncbi:SDR family oxidoreductase [Hymenobacter arizonensis]|uniref:Gluconate 5-dehydrogenase n=1 Tax=Hymenobacter arizonensis TaxID=1227077 RepID=A0A1I5T465_HYMAR|nr:SDR family oxidoreductase [Hymenobacter arizonensis]SFP77748.1 gluconate 5-dehydrogenase [Hymenobacter arizonensis]